MGDAGWDLAEPRAGALIESLRAFGYSPETAVADLIDNSISVGARRVDVSFLWDGRASRVSVRDDGAGMGEAALIAAMRPGSTSPLDARDPKDLGRFGLGLKTASFSQARELTVMTRTADDPRLSTRRWDLTTVEETGQWRLLRSAPPTVDPRESLSGNGPGTVVLWTQCDRLVGDVDPSDAQAQTRFNAVVARVADHLAAVFHRFLTGRGRIIITVNGRTLTGWDPFMEGHPFTQNLGQEELTLRGLPVTVTSWVLPHRSKLDDEAQRSGAGVAGWNHQQGFYLYRGRRLLVAGDWLGLGFAKDEHTKLARIRVDIPTALDHEWQVDVRKSSARAPGPLREDLRRIAASTRRRAEEVYRHRGRIAARRTSQPFVMAWQQYRTRDGELHYRVNREHPVVAALRGAVPDHAQEVERTLRLLEETIPTTLIGISIAESLDTQPVAFDQHRAELPPLLGFLFDELVADGTTRSEALTRLAAAEPFIHYPHVVQAFREGNDI